MRGLGRDVLVPRMERDTKPVGLAGRDEWDGELEEGEGYAFGGSDRDLWGAERNWIMAEICEICLEGFKIQKKAPQVVREVTLRQLPDLGYDFSGLICMTEARDHRVSSPRSFYPDRQSTQIGKFSCLVNDVHKKAEITHQ